MKISDSIIYVGVNDHNIDLFEGHYTVPNGISYNSYVILDEKTAVFDSVGEDFGKEWLFNIEKALEGKTPDYLIIQHMEPDHSRNLHLFMKKYPDAKIVASAKAWPMMKAFNGSDYSDRSINVGEGDSLDLGGRILSFVAAPMVHWPEVIMTYDPKDKVLFSADAFGTFGALDYKDPKPWAEEARRYYIGIVGKYGAQVQALLKKAAGLDIKTICSLHGPVLNENLGYYLNLYNIWSSYEVESEGVAIFYTSVYGHTKEAALMLEKMLKESDTNVIAIDLARWDWADAVAKAFQYGKIVLATTTYNGDMFPTMRSFVDCLKERFWQKRKVAIIENGSWGPTAARKIKDAFTNSKELEFVEPVVSIRSALSDANIEQLKELAAIIK